MNAFCAISDSGTISEESSILSFPAITVRNAMDTGNIILTGLNPVMKIVKQYLSLAKGLSRKYKNMFQTSK